jgi:hypothetical protein
MAEHPHSATDPVDPGYLEGAASHAHAAGHKKGHRQGGYGDDHGGGGHGGSWIVTYCDMITLLIACFICIITFASKEKEKYFTNRDSVLYGPGGGGVAGRAAPGGDHDSVIWRQRPMSARFNAPGSETAPMFSDPALEVTAEVFRQLDGPTIGTVGDRYVMRVPLASLFVSGRELSATGKLLLRATRARFTCS